MAIKRNLDHLPAVDTATDGRPPDPDPYWGRMLVDHWMAHPEGLTVTVELPPRDKPTAFGTTHRFSRAGDCARAVSLRNAGAPDKPFDAPSVWVTSLGTIVHGLIQAVVPLHHPDAVIEAKGQIGDNSGSADVWVPSTRHLVEYKTTGGFGYKMMVGERSAPEGPKKAHIIQTALNARAHDAATATISYLAMEAISGSAAARKGIPEYLRIAADWTFSRAELEPYAERELARLERIDEMLEDGVLAPKLIPYEMPDDARIVDVDRSRWEVRRDGEIHNTGKVWHGAKCAFYCSQVEACRGTAPDATPIPKELT